MNQSLNIIIWIQISTAIILIAHKSNHMKKLSEDQIDDLLKLKFGKLVEEPGHRAYISNKVLGKIF